MSFQDLPLLNACLNAVCAVFLTAGFVCVKSGKVTAHKRCMVTALFLSAAFLTSYVIYHIKVPSTKFEGEGSIRAVYFFILITHVVLAAVNVPLVVVTVTHALRERIERHKRWARFTLPVWWYVSVTGVVIYWMLYQCDFGGGASS